MRYTYDQIQYANSLLAEVRNHTKFNPFLPEKRKWRNLENKYIIKAHKKITSS